MASLNVSLSSTVILTTPITIEVPTFFVMCVLPLTSTNPLVRQQHYKCASREDAIVLARRLHYEMNPLGCEITVQNRQGKACFTVWDERSY